MNNPIPAPPASMIEATNADDFAAVDLGSNSFHVVIARLNHGDLVIIDRIRDMVKLGSGLDKKNRLNPETRDRALGSLARIGQRLRGIPAENIRAVGTQTLRKLARTSDFLELAESALGCPIEIIGGREEARLIFKGIAEGIAVSDDNRLIIDIGGGSTEIVIGEGNNPFLLESLQYGCAPVIKNYFADGRINERNWNRASTALRSDMQELRRAYRDAGWQQAIGSSGTIRSVLKICTEQGWDEHRISRTSVGKLKQLLLEAGSISRLNFSGLSEARRPVFVGGVVVLDTCMNELGIDTLEVSPYALREGVLYELRGRIERRDSRHNTVEAFAARYQVDQLQSERVRDIALTLFEHVAEDFDLGENAKLMLEWASTLYECGLAIAHSSYQLHSAYLLAESDMAGFSMQEQRFLASLVRYHRREIPASCHGELPLRLHTLFDKLLILLRVAVVLCRSRADDTLPDFMLSCGDKKLILAVPPEWAAQHPLTVHDLELEAGYVATLGWKFAIADLT